MSSKRPLLEGLNFIFISYNNDLNDVKDEAIGLYGGNIVNKKETDGFKPTAYRKQPGRATPQTWEAWKRALAHQSV